LLTDYLLVTFSDVVPTADAEFNDWYNETHLPEFVACPGFRAAARYRSDDGQPTYLALYEAERADALTSDEVKRAWGWGPMWPHIRNAHGRLYRRTFTLSNEGEPESALPPVVLAATSDVTDEFVDGFNHWYNEIHLPEILACPGFVSASRYECVSGEPQFLALYHVAGPEVLTTPEMGRAHGWGPAQPHLRSFHGRLYTRIHRVPT